MSEDPPPRLWVRALSTIIVLVIAMILTWYITRK